MYFVAIQGPFGDKATNNVLHSTKREAEIDAFVRNMHSVSTFVVYDADHEPGRSILASRTKFC